MHYAIGDIHGCYDLLLKALEAVESHAGDNPHTIVFLGDYIDRGPDSAKVVAHLMNGAPHANQNWIILKGNHEDMMVECVNHRSPIVWWLQNGGYETVKSFGDGPENIPNDVLDWCETLPSFYETEHHFFVHAGIYPDVPLNEQRDEHMLWIRDVFLRCKFAHEKHIVHGHTPQYEATLLDNRTNLDTGACFDGGHLSIGVFDTSKPGACLEVLKIEKDE